VRLRERGGGGGEGDRERERETMYTYIHRECLLRGGVWLEVECMYRESKRETQFTLYEVHASHERTCKHAHTHQKCHRRQGVPSKSGCNHGYTRCCHRSGAPLAWYKGASLVGNRSLRQSRSSQRYSDCSSYSHCSWNRGETDGTRHRRST